MKYTIKMIILPLIFILYCTAVEANDFVIHCEPHRAFVELDTSNSGTYFPTMMEIPRCKGASSAYYSYKKKCVPTEDGVEYKTIPVYNDHTHKHQSLQVASHTKCHEVCTINQTACVDGEEFNEDMCACSCKQPKPPIPNPCKSPFEWRKCRCQCTLHQSDCPPNMELRSKECGCFCKMEDLIKCTLQGSNIDLNTCQCIERGGKYVKSTNEADKPSSGLNSYVLALMCIVGVICVASVSFWFYRKRNPERNIGNNDMITYDTF